MSSCIEKADLLLTCKLGLERVVASYVKELSEVVEVVPAPLGFSGIVVVCNAPDKYKLAEEVKSKVPEVEKVFVVEAVAQANISAIVESALSIAKSRISSEESFAVRTTRRGKHSFTSIDVNTAVGSAVERETSAVVDLENPDKVVYVNILGDVAYISLMSGRDFYKKMTPSKYPVYKVFRRFVVAHEPYLGEPKAAYTMGRRVGREVQTFEVGELVVAPAGKVPGESLYSFLKGLFEGVESRFRIQKKSYGREVHRVQVSVEDMYMFVRSRFGKPLIIFEPEGEPISKVGDELASFILSKVRSGEKVHLMVGAREGVPPSLFRYADYVLDVAPGIVISTDYALASALVAIATVIHEKLVEEKPEL
mgnify:CR=1 FL=1